MSQPDTAWTQKIDLPPGNSHDETCGTCAAPDEGDLGGIPGQVGEYPNAPATHTTAWPDEQPF